MVYTGILPDLFKEGKGVVAQGQLGADGMFTASEVLAKHDENYMPPEAAHALTRRQPTKRRRAFAAREGKRDDPRTRPFRADPRAGVALVQGTLPLARRRARQPRAWMALARPAAQGQFVFVAIAFGCLA